MGLRPIPRLGHYAGPQRPLRSLAGAPCAPWSPDGYSDGLPSYENPIHRPAAATVNHSVSETTATSLVRRVAPVPAIATR